MEYTKTQEALLESKEKLSKVFNSTLVGFSIVNMEGVTIDVNKVMGDLFETTKEHLIGKTVEEADVIIIDEAYNEQYKKLLEIIQTNGFVRNEQVNRTLKSGKEITVLISVELIEIKGVQHLLTTAIDITDKKNAETNLKNSELLFRNLTSHAPVAIFQTDLTGACNYVNEEWLKHSGMKFEEAMGFGFADAIHPEDRERVLKEWSHAVTTKTEFKLQLRIIDKQGNVTWLNSKTTAVFDAQKNHTGYIGINSDITEAKKTTESIVELQSKMETALRIGKIGFWEWDIVKDEVFWSDRVYEIYNVEKGTPLKYDTVISRVHPDDQKFYDDLVAQRIKDKDNTPFEYRVLWPDGSIYFVLVQLESIINENGEVIQFSGTVIDITEKKKIENTIKKSEEKYRDLVDHIQDLVCTHDVEGNLLSVNPAGIKSTGFSEEKLFKMNLRDLMIPESRHLFDKYLSTILEKGYASGLMSVKNAAGETRIWEFNNTLRSDGVDTPTIRGMARDITEEKKAQQLIKESEEKFRDLVDHIQDLVSTHDLQGNLLSINPAATKSFGYSTEELLKMNLRDLLIPETRHLFDGYLSEIIEKGTAKGLMVIQTASGETGIWEYNNTLRSDGVDTPIIRAMARDITQERKSKIQLLKANKQFEVAEELASLGSWEFNVATGKTTWSKQIFELYGFPVSNQLPSAEEQLSRTHPDDIPLLTSQFNLALTGVVPDNLLLRTNPESVGLKYLNTIFNVEKNSDGTVTSIGGTTQDVTKLVIAEQAIKESEAKFRAFVEQAADGIIVSDSNLQIVEANDSMCKMLSYSKEELLGYKIIDITMIAKNEVPVRIEELKTGHSIVQERNFKRKDGTLIPVEVSSSMMANGNYLAFVRDITERKKTGEEKQKLLTLVETSVDFIGLATLEGKPIYLNSYGRKLVGLEENEDFSNFQVTDFFPPDYQTTVINEQIPKIFHTGQWIGEANLKHFKTGERIPIQMSGFLIRDEHTKEPIAIGIVATDITERKKTEETIKESEEKYRILSEASPDYIMSYDKEGRHVYMNKAALDISGFAAEQIIGKTHREAGFDPEQSDYWEEKIAYVFKTGDTVQEQFEWESFKGKMHLDWRLSPVLDANGKVISVLGVSRDITELILSEQKIIEKEAQLQLFIEYSPAALVMLDNDMNYINVSNQWLKNYKFKRETVIGRNHYEVFPEMPEHWKKSHQLCLAGASEKNEEEIFVRADGTIEWIRWEIHPWYKEENEIGGIIIFSELITEKKIANEALQQSLQRNTAFLNTIPDMFFVINKEGVIVDFHNPLGKETIASPDTFLGKKIDEVLPKEMAEEAMINIANVLQNNEKVIHYYNLEMPDGVRHFEARYAALNKTEVMTIVRDVTIEKQAEIKIKESEEQYRTLVEQASDGIIIIDQNGMIKTVNSSVVNLTGYTEEELLKKTVYDFVSPEDLKNEPFHFDELRLGKTVMTERLMKRKNKNPVYVEVNAKILADERLLIFVRDIAERKMNRLLIEGENKVLEMIATGNSLQEILSTVALNYEAVSPEAICSILLLDKDGIHLRSGAAPSLPDEFNNAIDGEPMGPVAGSCGTAVYRKEKVIVADIATDPLWVNYSKLALSFGLKACWSVPIITKNKKVLGTFAIYYNGIKIPTPKELNMLDRAVNQVRLVLESTYQDKLILESEEIFRTTLNRVTDGFVALDNNWCYTYMNKKAGEIFDRDPEATIGKNIWEEFPEGVGQPFHKAYEEAMREQKYIHFEEYYPPYNLWFENHIYPSPEGLSIYFSDVTKRKLAENELAESENRLRTILENEPECVKLLDKQGYLVEMNPAGLAMIEADNLEMVKGKRMLQLINKSYRDDFATMTKKVFEGESGKLEFEITGLKGTIRTMETHAVPFRNKEGNIIYLLGVTRDITDRKIAEHKIIQLNQELEQRVKERTLELETANTELQEVNDLFVGREARIIELKEELEALKTNGSLK